MYDLKIRGGTIVDGTGAAAVTGDVDISEGRLVAVGDAPDRGRVELDATDRVVCPGFIDIPTH